MPVQAPDQPVGVLPQADNIPSNSHGGSPDDEPEAVEKHEDQNPTTSHVLAEESLRDNPDPQNEDSKVVAKGAVQLDHDDVEVKNLGWGQEPHDVPNPVVGGLKNEEVWSLLRRFNKQVFQVRSIEKPPLADLDLDIAEDEEFSPDKLRARLERFYMTIGIGLVNFWKHIVRIRSWREHQRTSAFLAAYTVAWSLDLIVPTLTVFLMVLILHPPSRDICFPPAPPSMIHPKHGTVQKPPAGVMASGDSVTGAPEKHKGEAVEQEAHSFVNSIATLVVSTSAGKHPQADPHEDNSAPDPAELTASVSNARDATRGQYPSAVHDKTKHPVSEKVWGSARPVLRLLADLVDTWERLANALAATPPFPRFRPRATLAACLVPVLLISCHVTSYMLLKSVGFAIGFTLFGDPVITPMIRCVNRTLPRWQKYIELRHTILKAIPTDAQLTITLLRIGEKNKAPLPPPPESGMPPAIVPDLEAAPDPEKIGANEAEVEEAVFPDETTVPETHSQTSGTHKTSRRILNFVRGAAKSGIQTALTADKAKAKAGASHARNRLGVVKRIEPSTAAGPVRFPARFKGKKGQAYITTTATSPAISWTADLDEVNPAWTVPIAEIGRLRKVGGLGWKSKIAVGWVMDRRIVDGLVLNTKDGSEFHLTAIPVRDELFNRLIAMGGQMWESL